MRSVCAATLIGVVAAQDLFLEKYNSTDLEEGAKHRRRRRRRTAHTCTGGDLPSCVGHCLETDTHDNFEDCTHDGSSSCAESKCCQHEGWSCFVKNAYWSACAKTCKSGVPDSLGETWDCTPTSPSDCRTLQPCLTGCVEACPKLSGPRPTRGPAVPEGRRSGSCRGGSMSECKSVCHYADQMLTDLCNQGCEESCPEEPPIQCPKADLSTCISACADESKSPQHDDRCQKDGATSCLHSRCCQNPSDKCYTKNDYWAACQDECTPGQPNKNDGQIWQCRELTPRTTCDDYLYRSCTDNCAAQCPS